MKKVRYTPEMAKAVLANMGANRSPSMTVVHTYTRLMCDGGWKCDPLLALRFDHDGRLIDGQHRMLAVIQAGVPVDFYVDYTDVETLDLMHECRTRRMSHRVAIKGISAPGTSALYASLGAVLCDRMGDGVQVTSGRLGISRTQRSLTEIQAAYEWLRCESIEDVFRISMNIYRRQPRRSANLNTTVIAYMVAQVGDRAESFLDEVVCDDARFRCSSALTLRRQLGNRKYTNSEVLCMASMAYNNRSSKCLRSLDTVPDLIGSKFPT